MEQRGRDKFDMLFDLLKDMKEETSRRFDRLEDNLNRRFENHDERINGLEERQASMESVVAMAQNYGKRIGELERQQAHLQGKVAAWSGIVSAVITLVGRWMTGQGGQ